MSNAEGLLGWLPFSWSHVKLARERGNSSSCFSWPCLPLAPGSRRSAARCGTSQKSGASTTSVQPELQPPGLCATPEGSWRKSCPRPPHLPELEDACVLAAQRRGYLLWRSCAVLWHVVPVSFRVLVDALRPSGPKRAVANAQRLRRALEVLGPAFVKLGQSLAAREDVLSDEVAAELRKLCDQVPPFSVEVVRKMLVEEFGSEAPEVPDEPIAAASLGQVYRISRGGHDFALKVQRPGLPEALAVDVVILRKLAKVVRWVMRRFMAASVDPVRVMNAWAQTLWRELDYLREADSMQKMKAVLCKNVKGLVIPCVWWEKTTTRVLATVWVHGIRVTDSLAAVSQKHIYIGVETFAAMVLDLGSVHADPHAGNVLITRPGDELCLLDFGMVIEIPEPHRRAWAAAIVHMMTGKYSAVLDDLIEIGFFPPDCPRDELLPVMSKIWYELVACGSNIQKRKAALTKLYNEIKTFAIRFNFNLPDYYIALLRALVTLEGIAISADVEFDIFTAIFPVAMRKLKQETATKARGWASERASDLVAGLRSNKYAAAGIAALALAVGVGFTSRCPA